MWSKKMVLLPFQLLPFTITVVFNLVKIELPPSIMCFESRMDGVHEEVNALVQGHRSINTHDPLGAYIQEAAYYSMPSFQTRQLFKL
jgi:hypothetical protein